MKNRLANGNISTHIKPAHQTVTAVTGQWYLPKVMAYLCETYAVAEQMICTCSNQMPEKSWKILHLVMYFLLPIRQSDKALRVGKEWEGLLQGQFLPHRSISGRE